jgi:hypothetical protein
MAKKVDTVLIINKINQLILLYCKKFDILEKCKSFTHHIKNKREKSVSIYLYFAIKKSCLDDEIIISHSDYQTIIKIRDKLLYYTEKINKSDLITLNQLYKKYYHSVNLKIKENKI